MARKRKASSSASYAQPEEPNPNEESEYEPDSGPSEEEEENVEESESELESDPSEEEEEEEENGEESESKSDSDSSEEDDETSKRDSIRKLLEPLCKDQIIELFKQGALKDPSLLSRVIQVANSDPTHRKIFVRGLSWDATTEQVLDAFKTYGEIEECKLITDKATGKSKGFAFVLFKNRAAAQKSLKQPQKRIGNRTTYCQLASVGPISAARDTGNRKIYVGNVGPNIIAENLHAFFSKFGEIEEGPLGFDPVTRKPRGFAIFVYKTSDGAKKALEEPLKVFDGCQLHCKKFVENLKENSTNNAPSNTANQAVQQTETMNYGIGMNPGMLFMGQNPGMGLTPNHPLLGLATPALGGGNYGMSSLNPGMISNYGSHMALHGLGAFQNAQMVPPSIGGNAVPVPTSTPPNTQPGYGSAGTSFPSYLGR